MLFKFFIMAVVLLLAHPQWLWAASEVKCRKQAEAIGMSETKKKGNLPKNLISVANPTEMDGPFVVVYIGAHANYNYFKMKFDKMCKLIEIVDVEYAR